MSQGFSLDTPEQKNMWVLLSRRHQIQLQLKGLKTPGLVKWCKANIPGAEKARTAKDCIVPVEYAISQAGGEVDYGLVNVQVLVKRMGLLFDAGIFSDIFVVEMVPAFIRDYQEGRLEIVLTLDEPRKATNEIMVPA
jgi:hypothetical protein